MRRRILLTGASGQLGYELARSLGLLGDLILLHRSELDMSEPLSVRRAIRQVKPDWVVNTAAYMAVEAAEENSRQVLAINTESPILAAEELKKTGGLLVHFTTGYVFDGSKKQAYVETDTPNPINSYGQSQWLAEQGIAASGCDYLLLRTGWRYSLRRANFVLGMKNRLPCEQEIRVVDDQLGNPVWVRHAAEAVLALLSREVWHSGYVREHRGLYHLGSSGEASWFDLAQEISSILGKGGCRTLAHLVPVSTVEQGSKVMRPLNSMLDSRKFEQDFGIRLPAWQLALEQCMSEAV